MSLPAPTLQSGSLVWTFAPNTVEMESWGLWKTRAGSEMRVNANRKAQKNSALGWEEGDGSVCSGGAGRKSPWQLYCSSRAEVLATARSGVKIRTVSGILRSEVGVSQ